jgi:hypothetical protein
MQSTRFEDQPGMSAPWGFQTQLNNIAMLPVMHVPSYNVVACPCPSMSTPHLLASRNHANVYKSNLKAQARIQTQQIDSAIQLLKMQYDAIMASVQKSNQPLEQSSAPPPTSATLSKVVDQKSFAIQFELPRPESDVQGPTVRVVDSTPPYKRKTEGDPDGISNDSESCPQGKTSDSSLQAQKRLRRH